MWGKKNKWTIKCDKWMVTCDIETAQCKKRTVKYDVLETSEYRTPKKCTVELLKP